MVILQFTRSVIKGVLAVTKNAIDSIDARVDVIESKIDSIKTPDDVVLIPQSLVGLEGEALEAAVDSMIDVEIKGLIGENGLIGTNG